MIANHLFANGVEFEISVLFCFLIWCAVYLRADVVIHICSNGNNICDTLNECAEITRVLVFGTGGVFVFN